MTLPTSITEKFDGPELSHSNFNGAKLNDSFNDPNDDSKFDYSMIPEGFYQTVVESGSPVRKAWHLQKFDRVIECLPSKPGQSILDVGCFAGTFLSLLPKETFPRQLGVDILEKQIQYAQARFGTDFRAFQHVESISRLSELKESFDCVVIIEVIEHLTEDEIHDLFSKVTPLIKKGGKLILSTPNYTSAWPLVELAVNWFSEVSYKEQHITKFNYFTCTKKLARIFPELKTQFKLDFKTTTHFLAPFLASLSFRLSMRLSKVVPHQSWRNPFGNLILFSFTRI